MFLLGLLGSGHCIGMCGPLILAFPARTGKITGHLAYHLGRIVTYTVTGIVIAAAGTALTGAADSMEGVIRLQILMSMFAAALLVGLGLIRLDIIPEPGFMNLAAPSKIPGFRKFTTAVLEKKSPAGMFGMGLFLGFLPCGLSYAAFARVFAVGSLPIAAVMILCFGAGTLPALLFLGTTASKLVRKHRKLSDILAGILMIFMGLVLAAKAWGGG